MERILGEGRDRGFVILLTRFHMNSLVTRQASGVEENLTGTASAGGRCRAMAEDRPTGNHEGVGDETHCVDHIVLG